MPDNINITDQVNVSVTPNTTNVVVSSVGIQGPVGSSGSSSNFYPWDNPNNYSTSGNVESTGTALQNQIDLLENVNASGLATSGYVNVVSGSISERLSETGTILIGLISAASAGVSSINSQSGIINILGTNGIEVNTQGQNITISGTGNYYDKLDEQRILTEIPSGSGQLFVDFNYDFGSIPMVWSNIQTTGDVIYYINSTTIESNRYKVVFSDTVSESGLFLHSLVKRV